MWLHGVADLCGAMQVLSGRCCTSEWLRLVSRPHEGGFNIFGTTVAEELGVSDMMLCLFWRWSSIVSSYGVCYEHSIIKSVRITVSRLALTFDGHVRSCIVLSSLTARSLGSPYTSIC